MLKELDLEGIQLRKVYRLKRRLYVNRGFNDFWYMDGYDKLKLFGFLIYGVIDGFSRKILWFEVARFNNLLDNIAMYFLNIVQELKGCSV